MKIMQMEVGSIAKGKVSGIAAFGAFVELEGGKTGLVHISEVAQEYVDDINKHLKVGQEISVKVMSIDPNGKISLSIKRTIEVTPVKKPARRAPEEFDFGKKQREVAPLSFEDKLLKFKQDSDEKIQDLKRNTEGKRSGGYRRAY